MYFYFRASQIQNISETDNSHTNVVKKGDARNGFDSFIMARHFYCFYKNKIFVRMILKFVRIYRPNRTDNSEIDQYSTGTDMFPFNA